jgi:hypothetical protein
MGLKAFTFSSLSSEGQPIEILPCITTPLASAITKPGAPVANAIKWPWCQGEISPSLAEY